MNFKNLIAIFFMTLAGAAVVSCKVEDPFVDRNVAPLLVDVVGAAWASPFATVPSVNYDSSSGELVLGVRLLKLDKTHILDHTKGIDSIPAPNVSVKVGYRIAKGVKAESVGGVSFKAETYNANGLLGEAVSNADGLVSLRVSYGDFGLSGNRIQRGGDKIELTWSGAYEGQSFTRLSQINVSGK